MFKNLKLKIILWLFGVWFWLFGFAVAQAFYTAKINDLQTAHANCLKTEQPLSIQAGLRENDENNN